MVGRCNWRSRDPTTGPGKPAIEGWDLYLPSPPRPGGGGWDDELALSNEAGHCSFQVSIRPVAFCWKDERSRWGSASSSARARRARVESPTSGTAAGRCRPHPQLSLPYLYRAGVGRVKLAGWIGSCSTLACSSCDFDTPNVHYPSVYQKQTNNNIQPKGILPSKPVVTS